MAGQPEATGQHNPFGARPVRDEDAFDVPAMAAWLRHEAPALGLPEAEPGVWQFPGGASNLTYLLRYPGIDLVLRRPPAGTKAASAHDMGREFGIQDALRPRYPHVAEVLAWCQDESVIGSDFYVMRHVPGLILRADPPPGLLDDPADARALGQASFDALADLHALDVAELGLESFYKGSGYAARQVAGWSERYRRARTPDLPDAEALMAWLAGSVPADVGARLIHGDWRLDNLVLDPHDLSRIRAVLDWEMATVGDPLMDLGSSLAYWVQADDDEVFQLFRRQPSNVPGMPTRAEIVERYLDRTGLACEQWEFYEVFGLFRLAVIVAQIWHRYVAGQTTNPSFAGFGQAATYLIGRAEGIAGLR